MGVFADSFYAQVLAYSAGLGLLVDEQRLRSHLATQLKRGCVHFEVGNATALPGCPNGMVTSSPRSCRRPPPGPSARPGGHHAARGSSCMR